MKRIVGIIGIDWCGICGRTAKSHQKKATRVRCVDLWLAQLRADGRIV